MSRIVVNFCKGKCAKYEIGNVEMYMLLLWDLKFRAFCIDFKNESETVDAKKANPR